MKFTYQYRTADNVSHRGTVEAANRDVAFDLLRARGVKPYGLAVAPGFLNKLLGKGKRWTLIVLLVVVAGVFAAMFRQTSTQLKTLSAQVVGTKVTRHQVYGDPSIMDEMIMTGFASVFSLPGERLLAFYAQPGLTFRRDEEVSADSLLAALNHEITIAPNDIREVREIKAIVNGMKEELRAYLADGTGTVELYLTRLEERQLHEQSIRDRIVTEMGDERDEKKFIEKNAELRALGLQTLSRPIKSGVKRD